MRLRTIAANWVIGLVVSASAGPVLAAASDAPSRSIAATMIPAGATAILIDGTPNEEVWAKAPVLKDFVQRRPVEAGAPTYGTEARVLFDAANLYIAVTAT